jgi:hypothetical protein
LETIILAVSVAMLAACGGAELQTSDGEEDLARGATTFVLARRDQRLCPSPMCGGYWLRELNRQRPEIYVGGLDFAASGLDPHAIDVALQAGPGELLLRGALRDESFAVHEAYRGLPGVTPGQGESWYRVEANASGSSSAWTARQLNTGRGEACDGATVDRSARPFVDTAFLADRLLGYGAVAAARMRGGIMDASQIFLRLPIRLGPCPERPIPSCDSGMANVFTRSEDLCEIPAGCAPRGICPDVPPACDPAYRLASWPAAPDACPAFRCDPGFIAQ